MKPIFPEIAGGNIDPSGAAPGDKLQGAQGCTVVCGGTGINQIILDPPYNGLGDSDLIVLHGGGFGSAPGPDGCATGLSSISNGSFILYTSRVDTDPSALAALPFHFIIKRRYNDR